MHVEEREAALRAWRQAHPAASWDEIEDEVLRQVAEVQAEWMAALASAVGYREEADPADPRTAPSCPACATPMRPCGQRQRLVLTRLGRTVPLQRAYYVCPACGAGLFPPG
jgi:hypothetical protein